ncbi:cilia- and flagella-associated protein 95 [Latimeria chalumnae]|uniref:cilia- and flagella-associated protein 95 n=1 Tax=Latimeria chalumnae TaxID=7897 RepID=UPI00313F24F3
MDLLKPDLLERKGSLALRSNHMMEYSRPTLTFHCIEDYREKLRTVQEQLKIVKQERDEYKQGSIVALSAPLEESEYGDGDEDSYYDPDGDDTGGHLEDPYDDPPVYDAKIPEEIDYSAAYKKCYSQFTDICTSRKSGINTWQDESGIYPNSEIKWKRFKAANPITHCTD